MNWINKTKLTIRKDKGLFSNIDKLNTRITNLPRVLCVLRMCTGCKHTYCVLRLCMDIVINEYVIWLFRSASDRGALWSGVRVSPIEILCSFALWHKTTRRASGLLLGPRAADIEHNIGSALPHGFVQFFFYMSICNRHTMKYKVEIKSLLCRYALPLDQLQDWLTSSSLNFFYFFYDWGIFLSNGK